ncbi:hypothetical protein DB41_AE00160 [Neochlamydia sp. TUME1]|uniref:hypothetical protein n=1 Tax=unclassified Neochlamydia TaxID=2643326 RepID=UPI00057C6239|nr:MULTISPECIES: hypothetical protein [unclassified Neochlamydia]KIC71941.1 hypothetical protein DB41_AE00160 [Neochlamydia sp. TUME1]BBI17949.1 Putative uncharacterized protein [Neochlamydia sp. S13]
MSALPKKKLCWNCEGRVAFSDENCPYCGVYLSSSSLLTQHDKSLTHIAPFPSYRQDSSATYDINKVDEESSEEEEDSEAATSSANYPTSFLLPFVLLLTGSVFLIFGIILFSFSQEGILTLQWNANYWFLYLGTAGLLIFLSWRAMRSLD